MSNSLKEKSINSFVWKTGQSVCNLGMTFVIQLVLARMLAPESFGIIAISTVFMTLANTIIETSFSSSVIQRSSLEQKLTSSIFYANIFLSVLVYGVLFVISPFISDFYAEPLLIPILRVQGLKVVLSGFYSIPQAFLNRKMRFKTLFFCSFIGSIGQAVVGFAMAYAGAGVWALVISNLAYSIIAGIAIIITEPWKPSLYFSYKLVKDALSFSSKVLAIRVIRKIFYNIRVLAIGRVYDTETLGYFNKGFQFPSTAMTVVDGSLTAVAFTSLAKLQDDMKKFVSSLRQFVRIAMFLCTPLMVGMAMVAKPMVTVLLTDKWLDCVPFLQIICISQFFVPLNIKTTAFEALGDSKMSMRLHVSSIALSLVLLFASIPFSALVMAFSGVVSNVVLQIVIAVVTARKMNYTIKEQLADAFCGFIPSVVMAGVIYVLSSVPFGNLLKLLLEIICGVAVFVAVSVITRNKVFYSILNIAKAKLLKR